MEAEEREELERELIALIDARRIDDAATLALKGYGPEIFRLLCGLHEDLNDARDVFSMFCEGLWRGMRGFEQRSSVRTWASRIARNASIQYRTRSRRKGREVLAGDSTLEALAEEITTTTASRLERARNELVALRLELPHDDQELLILRAERGLSFRDIAVVMSDPVPVSDEDITREAARLRKRFQMVKDRLHALAKERGIAWTS